MEEYVSERGYPALDGLRFTIYQSFRHHPQDERKENIQIYLKLADAEVQVGVDLHRPYSEKFRETKANLDYLK